jgi:hypothetical protein
LALKMWSLCHFFFHKNHLYESYLIFCHKVAEKFTPKKKKKSEVNFIHWPKKTVV